MLLAGYLLCSLFDLEDEGSMFLRNIGKILPTKFYCTTLLYTTKASLLSHCCENINYKYIDICLSETLLSPISFGFCSLYIQRWKFSSPIHLPSMFAHSLYAILLFQGNKVDLRDHVFCVSVCVCRLRLLNQLTDLHEYGMDIIQQSHSSSVLFNRPLSVMTIYRMVAGSTLATLNLRP
jgi:hypothetical protein